MHKSDNTRLRDILAEARRAQKFVIDSTQDDFYSNDMLAYAVIRTLQIIGEAASKVSSDMQTRHPQIAWRQMVGMRNRIIHDYGNTDLSIVWETVVTILPELITQLELILPPE